MWILGISCYYHDAAAALIKDGAVLAAAEEERFSRMKHDHRFPSLAIQFCLEHAGITAADLDFVVFYEKPGIKFDRILATLGQNFPGSKSLFNEVMRNWGKEKLWISETIQARLKVPKDRILFSEHHLSHAASAFYCSPFKGAAVLTVDGVGEWITTTLGSVKGNEFSRSSTAIFPHSIGLLYSAFTEFLGFEVNDGEYKVMGMAPYGSPLYVDKVRKLFRNCSSSGFELDLDYFAYMSSVKTSLTSKFLELWGEPRKAEEPFFIERYAGAIGQEAERASAEVLKRSTYYADVAASLQVVVEDVLVDWARSLRISSGLDNLCVAGGVAYNSVANGRILRESGFKDVYIQPAAGDSGAAVGAALAAYYAQVGAPANGHQVLEDAYLGKQFSDSEVRAVLDRNGCSYHTLENEDELVAAVAGYLSEGKVIGWFQGRFEFGPRALGCRSILADPRSSAMKEVVNARVKFRELFRPFAPSCLEEYAPLYYDFGASSPNSLPYRFMLCVVPVQEGYRDRLGAVTHVDGSARIQLVNSKTNARYHKLIKAFGDITGIYALLNTSFNRRGEPIVGSPQDALTTFEWSAIDYLVAGSQIVKR